MAAFPHLALSTLPGRAEALLHDAALHAYAPPLTAFAVALALGLIGKMGARPLLGAAGSGGALAGWAALLPLAAALRAVLAPRAMADFLLLPAAAAVLAGLASPWLRGRAERWLPTGLAVLAGWWLAGSAPGRPEFWRVWLAIGVAAWLLVRAVGRRAAGGQMLAAALALWGGLLLAGAPPVWIAAALVAVAAAAAAWCLNAALPPVLVATVVAAADLGTGRLVRAGLNAADLACLLAIGAAWLAPSMQMRFGQTRFGRRLGRASPAAAALGAAALASGTAWLSARFLQR
jgi:hypothetical protein